MKVRKKQKGVALFMTLLIISVATLLASEMWFNNTLDVSRQYNNRSSYQALHYSRGMILWAKDVLRKDYELNSTVDTRNEPWNQTIRGIPVEDAVISGQLSDLSSKFNLNNLSLTESQISKDVFTRMLQDLKMDVTLLDKIIDWIDADNIPRPQGAEDLTYSTRKPYLKTAGQPFTHVSELRLIDGMTEENFQRLKQYVTVVPIEGNQPTKINVNTTSVLILKALDPRIQINYARALYQEGAANYQSLDDFFRHPAILRPLGSMLTPK
jgi:general secretion pathway protein K